MILTRFSDGVHLNNDCISEDENRAKTALTELFQQARSADTPILVERIVDDIDEIVRMLRFDGWQATNAGEREVSTALSTPLN
ncbi:MAG: hypothetical protein WCK35_17570 [Chloroflexota bacterium]